MFVELKRDINEVKNTIGLTTSIGLKYNNNQLYQEHKNCLPFYI
jgi:hypothetical protein